MKKCDGEIDWNRIEPRIRPHVKALRDAGFETTSSCGHDMTISLDIEPARLPALYQVLVNLGYSDFEVTYTARHSFHRWKSATVKFGGDLAGDGTPFDLVLLKVDPEWHPIYLVIKTPNWGEPREPANDEYFYGEHTCPTNWTRDILAVIAAGDEDPHGVARFVRRIAAPESMDADGDNAGEWADLFPEVRGGVA